MMESIEERRYLEREEIRDEYFKLSPRERGNMSLEEYTEQELSEREGDRFWNWAVVIGVIVVALGCLLNQG